MTKSPFAKRDEQHELSRRALIKWSLAAGAALGVSRSKICEILDKTAGKGVAYAAATNATKRSFHIIEGNGGLSRYTQFWPLPAIAQAKNAQFSWNYNGQDVTVAGTKNPLTVGPQTAWASLPAARQVTAFLCGANETHTKNPASPSKLGANSLYGVVSALQSVSNATVPLITVGGTTPGTAPGGARPAAVANADGIAALFGSAASQTGGLLSTMTDSQLYAAQYRAYVQLNRAANRPTTKIGYTSAAGASSLLGQNLTAKLAVTPADLTKYGVDASVPTAIANIARAMIISTKAFGMNLTNSVMIPGLEDDPHGEFDSGNINTSIPNLKKIFDAFMADLTATSDDVTNVRLVDDTVITITGDTYKAPMNRAGWGDNTPGNTNIMYVYSAGMLDAGWHGSISAAGAVTGYGANGQPATYNSTTTANVATAAVAFAIANADERAISTFTNGTGVTVGGVFGPLKAT